MKISIVQTSLAWEDKKANLARFDEKLAPLAGQTDLVVLPEMFTTGFSMNPSSLAEDIGGYTANWMRRRAEMLNAAVAGSFICQEKGRFYNRFVFMRPDGQFDCYDKRHLFSLAGEHEHYEPGKKRIDVVWKGFKICPLICYDLRFPVWSRNRSGNPYDLLLYVANWPNRRAHHWKTLLPARAVENQSYCAGVNIVGTDGNGFEYSGDSAVIDFSGNHLCQISGQEGIFTAELSMESLVSWRLQLQFLRDQDEFSIQF